MIPRMAFRQPHDPMMILAIHRRIVTTYPVTDQHERLATDHPDLVICRMHRQIGHNIFQSRPDCLCEMPSSRSTGCADDDDD